MKTLIATALTASLVTAPLAFASGTVDDAKRAIQIGSDYGISHFHSIELEDDRDDDGRMEIEGWVDGQWYVELDIDSDGTIQKEERRKRNDGPWGLTAADVEKYIDASAKQGINRIEDIKINAKGEIEVEGDNAEGQELEIDYHAGSMEPTRVDKDGWM
ncbi:hypothetical protein FE845_03890 [Marinobacter sp. 1-4A]|jgi:hypothetical protein|uniref:hypothetical protein n=1 Tax=Marinobacter sp. 1-4A TaxID=2582919 RepID=UPI001906D02F|nr:hypothetical protein [Marinobacter sp. 1-4A]MBK1850467.1 hypothetical protein [Marinobacter sp. 1-4A]